MPASKTLQSWALNAFATMGFVLGSVVTASAVEQPVQWTNQVNVTARGGQLQKIDGCQGCDDAGAVSRQLIRAGDGYAEFRVDSPNTFWVAGLSRQGTSTHFNDIDFAFRFNGAGEVDVLENGAFHSNDTTYQAGDIFTIAVVDRRVQYLKNGSIVRESQKIPQYPLVFAAALGTVGGTIADARIETNGGRLARGENNYGYPSDAFAALDRNQDGVLTVREFDGSRRAFNSLDMNHDGALSFREFSRADNGSVGTSGRDRSYDESGRIGTSGREFVVDPTRAWTPTGIHVNAGDWIAIDAQGNVQLSANRDDVAGPGGLANRRQPVDGPMGNRPAGALIGRIGSSEPFFFGEQGGITALASGELFFGVNDGYLRDNSGEYDVIITLDRR